MDNYFGFDVNDDANAESNFEIKAGAKTLTITGYREVCQKDFKQLYPDGNLSNAPQSHKALILNTTLSNCEENGYSHSVYLNLWSAKEGARGMAQQLLTQIRKAIGVNANSPQDFVGGQFDAEFVKNGDFLNLKNLSSVGTLTMKPASPPQSETPAPQLEASQPANGSFQWQS